MTELEKHFTVQSHLNNLCILLNGTLKKSYTLDYTGKQTAKYTIEFERSNDTDPNGMIVATLSVIVAGYIHGNMHLLTTLKNAANP